ncbi:MAG: DMT family transporter [Sneathiella sp.]|nr:DMT family transporter [Sneathiella sp.]
MIAAWILALGAALFYGLALVLSQFGLRHRSPIEGASISVPTAALFFLLLSPFLIDFSSFHLTAFFIFIGIGVLFPGMVTLVTFVANHRMGPTVAGAIGNLTPLFAVLFAILIFNENFGIVQAAGISVIIAGVTLLTLSRNGGSGSWPLWIILLPLSGAAIRGIMQPGIKLGLEFWPDPFAAVTTGYVVSSLFILMVVFIRKQTFTRSRKNEGTKASGFLWFVAVGICNGVAVLLTYEALSAGKITLVSPLIATYPLVTLILSRLLLRDTHWNFRTGVGIMATVAGVGILLGGESLF